MSQQDNPMGEHPIGAGRRPVAHYIGMTAVVIVLAVIVVSLV